MKTSASIYTDLAQSACEHVQNKMIKDCAIGQNCLAVTSDLGCGLAFLERSFWSIMPSQSQLRAREKEISSMDLDDLIPLYLDDHSLTAALALAAINAVCSSLKYTRGEFDLKSILTRHKRLAMVGFFRPLMPAVQSSRIDMDIFELRNMAGAHRPEAAAEIMPKCDVVVFIGSTFVNKTFHYYQPHLAPRARVYILGPSTPLVSVLGKKFNLGGSLVHPGCAEKVSHNIRQGYNYRRLQPWLMKVVSKVPSK